jgi:hypothetical protein
VFLSPLSIGVPVKPMNAALSDVLSSYQAVAQRYFAAMGDRIRFILFHSCAR